MDAPCSITIGLPFYNAEAYLAQAIRSVYAQTHQDWELILVDDGSTDRSLDIARSVRDKRVRVISDKINRQLAYRLNQITSEAKYDFIGRMDADDLISPTRFEKQVAVLSTHPELDLVSTGICSITNDRQPIGVRCGSPGDSITGRKLLLGQCTITHAAILGRKSWFLRNRYDCSVGRTEDYELWLRAFSQNDFRIYIIGEPLYYYREEANVSPKRLVSAYAHVRHLYKRYGHLGFKPAEIPFMEAKMQCKSLAVRFLSMCDRMDLLLKKRNSPIADVAQLERFLCEIDQVLRTRVPGLD